MLGKHSKIRIQNKLAMSTQLVFCYLRINDVSCLMRRLLPRSKKGMRSRPNPKVRSVWHYFVISLSPSVGGKEVIIIFSMRIPSRPATMEELPHFDHTLLCLLFRIMFEKGIGNLNCLPEANIDTLLSE